MRKKHLTKSRILSLRCRQYTVMQGGGLYGTPGEISTPPLPKPRLFYLPTTSFAWMLKQVITLSSDADDEHLSSSKRQFVW